MLRPALALLALTATTPALAGPRHPAPPPKPDMLALADSPMAEPLLAGALANLVHAVMDVRIDGVRNAIAPVDPEAARGPATLGETLSDGDPHYRARADADSARMAHTAVALARAAGRLQKMTEELQTDLDDAAR